MSNRRKYCRSCGEPIPIKLKNYLGILPNTCLNCLNAAIQQLRKDEQQKYYGLDPLDV